MPSPGRRLCLCVLVPPQGTGLQEGRQESLLPPPQAQPVPEPNSKSPGWDESGSLDQGQGVEWCPPGEAAGRLREEVRGAWGQAAGWWAASAAQAGLGSRLTFRDGGDSRKGGPEGGFHPGLERERM